MIVLFKLLGFLQFYKSELTALQLRVPHNCDEVAWEMVLDERDEFNLLALKVFHYLSFKQLIGHFVSGVTQYLNPLIVRKEHSFFVKLKLVPETDETSL